MLDLSAACSRLANIEGLRVERDAPLSRYTRFGLGGPASLLADAATEPALVSAITNVQTQRVPFVVIGGGSNLVVADSGYRGIVIRYTADRISSSGTCATAESGAGLQSLVDYTIDNGLSGIHTMTGIPGWVGGAVYGNAGAYGRSTHQSIHSVRFYDGSIVRELTNEECGFRYRHSRFKSNKSWIILASAWRLTAGDASVLRKQADEILAVRNAKYPPDMKCAGSIFKNLLLIDLPEAVQSQIDPKVIREGKVPSAYFLEQVGAKGIRNGDIHVAAYHANLLYNAGQGTSLQVHEIVEDLKRRVRARFGFDVEEEVQYVGF